MQFTGIHHLTAITAQAACNLDFYTKTLGLRLVKKTVNQDDVSAYHLFYADGKASPGTDITFFDWPTAREERGTRAIVNTALRVPIGSVGWWAHRFKERSVQAGPVETRDGRLTLDFEDSEGQRLSLVGVETGEPSNPWEKSPVAVEHQILGLGPITISVAKLEPTDRVLRDVTNMRAVRNYENGAAVQVYEMGPGGPGAELHVKVEPQLPPTRQGAGGAHHVAFRTPNVEEYMAWNERLGGLRIPFSGPVDRFYFRSLYFREPGGILFEIATDGPGFATDESMETLGERLSLPPFLEGRRKEIEAGLKPLASPCFTS